MNESLISCNICEKSICDNQKTYSFSLVREYKENGGYSVIESYSELLSCNSCWKKFKLNLEVESRVFEEVHKHSESNSNCNTIITINSQYGCSKCGALIRDGEQIVDLNHEVAIWQKSGIVQPVSTDIFYLVCSPCAESIGIDKILQQVSSEVITHSRRNMMLKI